MRYDMYFSTLYRLHFSKDYSIVKLPRIPLTHNERIIVETPTRFQKVEGGLVLTDKRLIFYYFEYFHDAVQGYKIVFDVPLSAIENASWKGNNPGFLIVDTDPSMVTGNERHEFFLMLPGIWALYITRLKLQEDISALAEEFMVGLSKGKTTRPSRFSKICINCMKAVPEESKVCPECGNEF